VGKALWDERSDNLQAHDPTLNCWPTGVPRQAGTPYPMQIAQSKDLVVIMYEGAAHTFRIIPTDGRPHGKFDQLWMGDSVGRWEGNTLVVDVVNFNDKTWLDSSGHPHSDKLHITERYTRPAPDTLRYEVTIDDPVAYTKSWTTTYMYSRRRDSKSWSTGARRTTRTPSTRWVSRGAGLSTALLPIRSTCKAALNLLNCFRRVCQARDNVLWVNCGWSSSPN